MSDNTLIYWLYRQEGTKATVGMIAANRIRELKRELARANQRIGLFQHHASKKKAKTCKSRRQTKCTAKARSGRSTST